MKTIRLNGEWKWRRIGDHDWKIGHVPGSVLSDLIQLGEMDDPFYRDNELSVLPIFEHDFEYVKTFNLTTDILNLPFLLLQFEGLDTISEVWLNGALILKSENMHRSYEINVKDNLVEGMNELIVIFRSILPVLRERHAANPLFGIPMVVEGYTHLRKAHYMLGWDWGPKLPDCGIWRDVKLLAYQTSRLKDVRVSQRHEHELTSLHFTLEAEQESKEELVARITITSPNNQVTTHHIAITHKAELTVDIKNPFLWWPNGYGEQPLYQVEIQLFEQQKLLDTRILRIGLRTLTVNTDPDSWGRKFCFVINGVEVFSMGADYIPEDNILGRMTRSRTEKLIQDCIRANFNTIRVWGGGFYPDDDFYDLCDQYGLIVWQDLMYSCGVYDLTPEFCSDSFLEISDNVTRIRHHASLGLICGNNEIEMFFEDGRIENSEHNRTSYMNFFERDVPMLVNKLASEVFYWPGSPSSGGAFLETNGQNAGDGHFWDVWHYNQPFTAYRQNYHRFMSEFGFESLPDMKTIESFTKPEDRNIFSYVMELHQKNPSGNQKILTYLSENYQYPKDLASLVYVSQLLQAEAVCYGVEHWRRNRGRCMGALYWQLNDCWPTASWSSIDSEGRWKALHYYAKRFYSPILASACEEGNKVDLYVSNELPYEIEGTLVWRLRNTAGEVLQESKLEVKMDKLSSSLVSSHDFTSSLESIDKKRNNYLEYTLYVDKQAVSRGTALFVPAKYMMLADPRIQTSVEERDDRYIISLIAQSFAMSVELRLSKGDAIFSDNYFHLSSDETIRVELLKSDCTLNDSVNFLRENLQVFSLFDTY